MALGLNTQINTGDGGDFTPLIMYMAREGRFYRRDRVAGGNAGFENEDVELPIGTKMAFDFGTISVGYMKFAAGMAPSFAVVPLGEALPAAPDKDHRQGFRMFIHLGRNGGKREFATTAKTVLGAVDDLHGLYTAAPEAAAGKIPLVEFTGGTRIVTENRHGTQTNFRPNFRIVQWIDRPADLGPRTVPVPGATATQRPSAGNGAAATPARAASPPARHVGPPAGHPAAEPAGGTVDWDAPTAGGHVGGAVGGADDPLSDVIPFAPCWQ